jgi:hypothetical protein
MPTVQECYHRLIVRHVAGPVREKRQETLSVDLRDEGCMRTALRLLRAHEGRPALDRTDWRVAFEDRAEEIRVQRHLEPVGPMRNSLGRLLQLALAVRTDIGAIPDNQTVQRLPEEETGGESTAAIRLVDAQHTPTGVLSEQCSNVQRHELAMVQGDSPSVVMCGGV